MRPLDLHRRLCVEQYVLRRVRRSDTAKSPLFCQTKSEKSIALHVLTANTRNIDMCSFLSTFGLLSKPGTSLDDAHGCFMPQIVFDFVPLGDGILSKCFLLPCSQNISSPLSSAQQAPLWRIIDDKVKRIANILEGGVDSEGLAPLNPRFKEMPLDEVASAFLGVPLTFSPFFVSDVCVHLGENGHSNSLTHFLRASLATHGCHVSVGESFEKATNAIKKQKTEVTETLTKLSCDRIKLALGNPNFKSYNLPMTNATNKFVLKM